MQISEALQQLGLSKREVAVYTFLLKNGSSTASTIAQDTKIARPNIYDITQALTNKGLVRVEMSQGARLIAAESPTKIEEIAKQQVLLAKQVIPFLSEIESIPGFRSKISFFEGRKAMLNLFADGLTTKKKEIAYLWSPKDMDKILGKKTIEQFITKRLKAGISIRSLRPSEKESFYANETTTKEGLDSTKVAYLPATYTFSLSMALYDDKVAFFSSQKESFGFLVESKEFAQMQRMFYEGMWQMSGKLK